ncbi:hypothetical protein [Streptomyces lavendofoliae]|uniref:Uncharacterized protein n=1 Tax=Streptomyces lavendofoliae TaxID=67314 RepID=A0A918M5W2_9ACTN|nr:hypothetical protein [Streptomyces lavendofoliae]GGU52344.1 hypothetical protein GCM10010274_46570 [Streptomyces lavendofoliae]
MTDLHGWITQQVERVEAEVRARLIGHVVAFAPDGGGTPIAGSITDIDQTADGLQLTVDQYGTPTPGPTPFDPDAVLRRCEADRRILARHGTWPGSDYCDGCGPDLDTRISECPELLDLAHAHGITDEILASLDHPEPPPRPPHTPRPERIWPTTPMADVPPALRGPSWQADR